MCRSWATSTTDTGEVRLRRIRVHNEDTGDVRLEVPREQHNDGVPFLRPCIHLCIDRGSIGWPASMFLFTHQKLRGTLFSDFAHDDWNALKNAAASAGCWLPMLERCVVLNLPSGPWQGSAFFGKLKVAANEFFASGSPDDELFSALFPHICLERRDNPDDYGTVSHRSRVWDEVKSAKCFQRKGTRARMGRWYNLFKSADEKEGEMMVLLMVLLYIGRRDGYWRTSKTNPFSNALHGMPASGDVAATAASAASGSSSSSGGHRITAKAPDMSKQSVKASNAELKKIRDQSANTLDLAARILGDRVNFRLFEGIRHVVTCFHLSFGQFITRSKTQRGMLDLYTAFARGHENASFMHKAFTSLNGGGTFHQIGFADAGSPEAATSAQHDSQIAGRLFHFVTAFAGHRLANHLHYMACLPGMFVLLVHPDASVRASCLRRLRLIWELLSQADVDAYSISFAQNFMHNLCWPAFCYNREVLLCLAECDFEGGHMRSAKASHRCFRAC